MRVPVFLRKPAVILFAVLAISAFCGYESGARENRGRVRWVRSRTGLSSLTTLSRDRGSMERHLRGETRSYESVIEDIGRDRLAKGRDKEEVRRRYGDPVVELADRDGDTARWVYKPSEASFFEGPKVYLFFGNDGLTGWEIYDKRSDSQAGP